MKRNRTQPKNQQGFTLIEVLISMFVLTIGLVSLLGVFAVAMASTQSSQQDLIAKQLASEVMESIFTARDTSQLAWNALQNTGNGGIFVDNPAFQPINYPGADGIVGTADDALAGAEMMTLGGKDGIVGTADDVQTSLSNYQRSVLIADVAGTSTLRTITVTVRYTTPRGLPKNYILTGNISAFR
jgi:prepilin-type N-terminal cleavage/methylation domain-containing protein